MLAKFHGNILNLSENIAKSLGGYFFWLTLYVSEQINERMKKSVEQIIYIKENIRHN